MRQSIWISMPGKSASRVLMAPVDLDRRRRRLDRGHDAVGLQLDGQRRRHPVRHFRRHVGGRGDRQLDLVLRLGRTRRLGIVVLERPGRLAAGRQRQQAEQHRCGTPHSMAHVAITPSRQQNTRMIR